MKVVEDFQLRPHKAVSFVVERDKDVEAWNEQKLPKVLPGYCGGRLPGRSTTEAGRGEKKVEKDFRERQVRHEIVQEVVAGFKKKAWAQRCQADRTQNSWAKCQAKW